MALKVTVRRDGQTLAAFEYGYQASAFARLLSKAQADMQIQVWEYEPARPTETWTNGKGTDELGQRCKHYKL